MLGSPNIIATDVVVVSDTQITCILPITGADPGSWDVTVENADLTSNTLAGAFTITAPPTVSSITPSSGLNTGSVTVTDLAGAGFQSGGNSHSFSCRKS